MFAYSSFFHSFILSLLSYSLSILLAFDYYLFKKQQQQQQQNLNNTT